VRGSWTERKARLRTLASGAVRVRGASADLALRTDRSPHGTSVQAPKEFVKAVRHQIRKGRASP